MEPIPDSMTLQEYVAYIRRHNEDDMDAVIMITGYEGLGKTTFAIYLSYELDPTFGIPKIVFYDVKDFWNQVNDETWYKVIMCDEAMKFLLAYDWGRAESKAIITELAFCRFKRKFFIFIVPSRKKINEYVRDHRALFWAFVRDRGLVDIHIGDPSNKWKEEIYWKEVGRVRYPDLPADIKELYQERKRVEKIEDQKRGIVLSSKYILNALNDGLLDDRTADDEKVVLKAHTYMALEEMFPYSTIPKGKISVAIDIWAN